MIHKRSTALERSEKDFTGVIKLVSRRANLTLSSDLDQDTYIFGLHERPLSMYWLLLCLFKHFQRNQAQNLIHAQLS